MFTLNSGGLSIGSKSGSAGISGSLGQIDGDILVVCRIVRIFVHVRTSCCGGVGRRRQIGFMKGLLYRKRPPAFGARIEPSLLEKEMRILK